MRVETVAEQIYFTTVYIAASAPSGSKWTATGFIHAVETDVGTVHLLVTNKHVLKTADNIAFRLVRAALDGAPQLGAMSYCRLSGASIESVWVGHPAADVDVAVFPIAPVINTMLNIGEPPFFRAVGTDLLPDEQTLAQLDALQQVAFVGYPNGLYDRANFLPIARLGHTATPPQVDYNGLPAFLIDASVFPGSSGSPVFLLDRGIYSLRNRTTVVGTRTALLGVVAAVHVRRDAHEVVPLPTGLAAVVPEALDLGIVFKSRAIAECVDEFLSQRGVTRLDAPPSAPPGETTAADAQIAGDLPAAEAHPSA